MTHMTVLIVEDSIYSADLSVRELKRAGFTVEYQRVSSAKAMLKALQEKQWDLILSDHSMPNFNAHQALSIRNYINGNIPFIIVSEDISEKEIHTALKNGCSAFIAKENLHELQQLVRNMLQSA